MTSLILSLFGAFALAMAFGLGLLAGQALEQRRRPVLSAQERRKMRGTQAYYIATHEAGHAVCAWFNPYTFLIQEIVVDEDQGNGHMLCLASKSQKSPVLWHFIVLKLGGIAAETKEFRKFRSGPAEDDLADAVKSARLLADRGSPNPPWGGSELPDNAFDLSKVFRSVVAGSPEARILNLAYARAKFLVAKDQQRLRRVAEDLVEKGRLTKTDILFLFGVRLPFFGD